MKKIFLSMILCCASSVLFAQLKVLSTDDVHIGYNRTSSDPVYRLLMGKPQFLYTIPAGPAAGQDVYTDARWIVEMGGNSTEYFHIYHGSIKSSLNPYHFYITADGRVGICKVPTLGKLDVNGDVYANGVKLSSDERLKSDIKPVSGLVPKLYLLEGKSYTKTLPDKSENFKEYGYLAQELKEIFPDLVSQDSAGYYAVNYIGLIPIIVEALKDQRLEIEKQQEQIKQLVKLMGINSINEEMFKENGIESIPLLLQNTPNPFNQATEIGYYIPETVSKADVYIYDINGFQQKSISISERGKGATILQASALKAGIYFYTLICDGNPVDTKQMILTR